MIYSEPVITLQAEFFQSKVWLFIDIKETRRLWVKALERSSKLEGSFSKYAWNVILVQAKQHPVLIRDVYEIIIDKDDFYYFKLYSGLRCIVFLCLGTPRRKSK